MKKILHLCFVIFFGILAIFPLQVFAVADAFEGSAYPNVCVGAPIEREEIGGTRFPVAPKYKHLNWLGQLFTADDCGEERLGEFFGSEDETYPLGSILRLKKSAKNDKQLRRTLKILGFSCNEGNEKGCLYWNFSDSLPVYKILLLKPYAKKMQQDDCVHCG
ncbi:MAG: hypothetical protein AAB588_04205 [Patescibacteria group bacterium]